MEKIAYLMLVHNDANHFARLIKKLDFKADFYVHIDLKSDINKFKEIVRDKENVFFC